MSRAADDDGPDPTVSVLVPAYQAERTLEMAVRSALQQTFDDLEVLVLDDASMDGTLAVAHALAEQDRRVRVLPSSRNLGVAATRNRGLDIARGTWVALLDADDAWLPSRLESLLAVSSDVHVVCDDVLILDVGALARGEVSGVRVLPWLGVHLNGPRLLGLEEFVAHDLGYLKPVLRRRALDERGLRYWPEVRVAEDFAFAVLALASGLTWRQVPEAYYCYRRGEPSLSSGPRSVAEQHRAMLPALLAVPEIAASPSAVRALRRHGERARATLAYRDLVQGLTRERAAGRLVTLLRQPGTVLLMIAKMVRRGWLTVRRRQLHANRLPEDSVEAVRRVWGLVGPLS